MTINREMTKNEGDTIAVNLNELGDFGMRSGTTSALEVGVFDKNYWRINLATGMIAYLAVTVAWADDTGDVILIVVNRFGM